MISTSSFSLSDFLADVDAKTAAWQNRTTETQRQQFHASYPQDPLQNTNSSAQTRTQTGPAQLHAQTDGSKRVYFNKCPRIFRDKECGNNTWSYLVDTYPDGSPQWQDEDPEDPIDKGDGYAEYSLLNSCGFDRLKSCNPYRLFQLFNMSLIRHYLFILS